MLVIIFFIMIMFTIICYAGFRHMDEHKKHIWNKVYFSLLVLSSLHAIYLSPYVKEEKWLKYFEVTTISPDSIDIFFHLSLVASMIFLIGYLFSIEK